MTPWGGELRAHRPERICSGQCRQRWLHPQVASVHLPQEIALASTGVDEATQAFALDLAPQACNEHIDHVAFKRCIEVVNVFPDVGAGDDSPSAVGEIFEKGVLAAAEVQRLTGPAGDAG